MQPKLPNCVVALLLAMTIQSPAISEYLVAAAVAWAAKSTQEGAEVSLENPVLSDPIIANWVTRKDNL